MYNCFPTFTCKSRKLVMFIQFCLIVCLFNTNHADFLRNKELLYEYNFMVKREMFKEKGREFGNKMKHLNTNEEIVKNYLQHLKQLEYEKTKDKFLPSQPLELVLDDIKSSKVYSILRKFPKGGTLHDHHEGSLSRSVLLDLIINSPLYEHLYIKREHPLWRFDLFTSPPKGWERVADNQPQYSKSEILKHITLLNVFRNLNTSCKVMDPDMIWKIFRPLLTVAGDQFINHVDLAGPYMEAKINTSLDENVQYTESRLRSYNRIYTLDSNPKYKQSNGKRILDTENGEFELSIIDKTIRKLTNEYPNFIGYKRIFQSFRNINKKFILNDMQKAYYLYRQFPGLVTGFDIVSEEDNGYSNLFFLENFASFAAQKNSLPYYFHAGSLIWPGDVMTSQFDDDLVTGQDNVLDSLILGSKRIGHGISLAKTPFLLQYMKEQGIAVEVCPASNVILGYIRDQRTHPGITYLRYGVPVVLGGDAPGLLGYDEFTVDWYYVFMAWGVDLNDLKQLAINSLKYSAMSKYEKQVAFQKWNVAYNKFIKDVKMEACGITNTDIKPIINAILPRGGPTNGGHYHNYVYVYGRNFQIGICQEIICKFGCGFERGQYIADHIIRCNAPKIYRSCSHITLDISISVDGGTVFLPTSLNYTFVFNEPEEIYGKMYSLDNQL